MSIPSLSQAGPLVWLVTGTSQGFGLELVRAVLERGDKRDRVVATSRTPDAVRNEFPDAGDRLLAIPLDFRDPAKIEATVAVAVAKFGRIDILVNNAGHGLAGAVEEAGEAEVARVFETNVFGLLRVTRAVLPYLRKQRRGHVVNLSSIGGLVGLPGWGIYNATKFAVEGLSEALAVELAPLGVGVTVVEPGPFRTDFLGGSLHEAAVRIADYDGTAGKTREAAPGRNRKQPGDPARGARAIVAAVTGPKPPLHLVLGRFAYERASQKLDELRRDFEGWREAALATDFPEGS